MSIEDRLTMLELRISMLENKVNSLAVATLTAFESQSDMNKQVLPFMDATQTLVAKVEIIERSLLLNRLGFK
jgi:hypothetical protein